MAQWFGQSTLEWQYGSSINRFSTLVAGKLAWIGVQWALDPRWTLTEIAATVLVLVLVLVLVQLRVVTAQVYVLWKGSGVLCAWCRAGEIPYAPRPFGLAHGGNRRNGNLTLSDHRGSAEPTARARLSPSRRRRRLNGDFCLPDLPD